MGNEGTGINVRTLRSGGLYVYLGASVVFSALTEQGHRITPMALNCIHSHVLGLLFEIVSRVALVSFGMPAS